VITDFNYDVSTFRGSFRRIGMRPYAWQFGFLLLLLCRSLSAALPSLL